MIMTNEEIVRSYRNSANPNQQVKVLAELNGTTEENIKRILQEGGVDHRKLPRQKPQQKPTKATKATKTPTNIMAVLRDEEKRLQDRQEEIHSLIPALEVELETVAGKLEAVERARAELAIVYGSVERVKREETV